MVAPGEVVAALRAAGCVYAEDEAALLVAAAASRTELDRLVAARVGGQPLETVLGWAEFRGLRIAVAPGVFVPRQRTSLLVTAALARLGPGQRVVVEMCCGTAAVGAALAAERPATTVYAADVSPDAVRCAAGNLRPYGGTALLGDLYAALPASLRGRVDAIVANAPYVPTAEVDLMPPEARLYEPLVALDGGPDGLDVQRRIAAGAREWLRPGGLLLVETGRRQAPATAAAFRTGGFAVSVVVDDDLEATVAVGALTSTEVEPPS